MIRSILLHFWLAYDHPFLDGNGRTDRALFYWSMLRHGYWFFEFVSISELIFRSSGAHYRACQYSEADEGDCSYFVVHQLDVLCEALANAEAHIARRQEELFGHHAQTLRLATCPIQLKTAWCNCNRPVRVLVQVVRPLGNGLIDASSPPENDNAAIQIRSRLGGLLNFYHRGAD